jgi:putative transposase
VGKNDIGRIYRLGYVVDKLQSKWSQKETRHKERYHLKKAAKRIRKKIKDLVKDVHCKLIKYLCLNYEVVLLPKFETKGMVSKKKRKIRSKTARAIITWSHFSFRERLLNKIKEYPECRVKLVTEEYTSKTCGSCGQLNASLGSKKNFVCPFCDYRADRDLNAARNILIKSLQETLYNNTVSLGPIPFYEQS